MFSKKNNARNTRKTLQMPVMEPLSPRMLMSATPAGAVAVPTYVLGHREAAPVQATATAAGQTAQANDATPTGYSPSQVRTAYGVTKIKFNTTTGDGTGQTIAIVDAYNDPTALSDLKLFDRTFGLSDPVFSQVNQTGGTALPKTDPTAGPNGSWAGEESLDIQWAHAIAPKANIVLVEANSASLSDLYTAVNTARNMKNVSVVSMSFGGAEWSTETQSDSLFTTPSGHIGVTFLASSGDSGAYDGPNKALGASYNASSPNIVAVGGTSLYTNSAGSYMGESTWSGSGGGISTYETEPSYQKALVTNTKGKRGVPDVSFLADPQTGVSIVDSTDLGKSSPWETIGGTSLACPGFAGLIAIADQGRVLSGKGTLDGATQTLPMLYTLPSSDFHDITSGNNQYYSAGAGYDLCTGRGTPVADRLVADLAGYKQTTPTPPPVTTATGSISGSVFWDIYENGVPLSGSGFSNVLVYVDLNHDGIYDKGDVATVTNSAGQYKFSNVKIGTYTVGVVDPYDTFSTTWPLLNVAVTAAKLNPTGVNFGVDFY